MCGNIGLLLIVQGDGKLVDIKVVEGGDARKSSAVSPLEPAKILREMVAATEIRGGQAGGLSAFEYSGKSSFRSPAVGRVRAIARKRYPLADDLESLFRRRCPKGTSKNVNSISVIGHTRFATGSANKLPELHPHDWGNSGYKRERRPFQTERVWRWDVSAGALTASSVPFGVHLTHNGDFDALEAYGTYVLNSELGLWLERVLHTPNSTSGDSPKMAGLISLLRVQGRWGPAARLAYLRAVCKNTTSVSHGERLSKVAPNTCPGPIFWASNWAPVFESAFERHASAVIRPLDLDRSRYRIDLSGVRALCAELCIELTPGRRAEIQPGADTWDPSAVEGFVHHTVRGFLRADLYAALTEGLNRAHGSFGLQAHCTMDPGVVVLGCKGQPMGVAYSPDLPIVLFGSEGAALAVSIAHEGQALPLRFDMDETGETVRVGPPAALVEGSYKSQSVHRVGRSSATVAAATTGGGLAPGLELCGGGIELRAYSLAQSCECTAIELEARRWAIVAPTPRYDSSMDLVAKDLRETPAVLNAIDTEWSEATSSNCAAASMLSEHLLQRMEVRRSQRMDTVDLLIGGVEVSLWLAQQLAADLREVFPALTVKCISTNKLLGISGFSPRRTFFTGAERVTTEQVREAAVLLVSQSGQTFPTLHATRLLATLAPDRVWLLTGTPASKMEAALVAARLASGARTPVPRVIITHSGHRPAEPTSLAAAATHHTMTHLLIHMATHVRNRAPEARIVQPWEAEADKAAIAKLRTADGAANASASAQSNGRVVHAATVSPDTTRVANESSTGESAARRALRCMLGGDSGPARDTGMAEVAITSFGLSGPPSEAANQSAPPLNLLTGSRGSAHVAPASLRRHAGTFWGGDSTELLIRLSDGCIADMRMMVSTCVVPNISAIVGCDPDGRPVESDVHKALRDQGHVWARHIREPWEVLVLVGTYIIVSVTMGVPVVSLLARLFVRASGVPGVALNWSLDDPTGTASQHWGWTFLGFAARAADAVIYIFCGKLITWAIRLKEGRPIWARHGKRTLVIVDTPTNHQMLEAFVSKLMSQAYSFCSLDVHGAAGVDHFVHRFTHRVTRGLLIAVGRPDGRMCCLAKTEASLLLACKQAAFIQNPAYSMAENSGNAPEIVSIGHNPFKPAGVARHIPLPSDRRRRFVDELVYERLHRVQGELTLKPARMLDTITTRIISNITRQGYLSLARGGLRGMEQSMMYHVFKELPFGAHFIPREDRKRMGERARPRTTHVPRNPALLDLIAKYRLEMRDHDLEDGASNDPQARLAFATKLDARTHEIQDRSIVLQHFYEARIDALERYIGFCVMFHAMAASSAKPWLKKPWDVARSQSNLRVATTASPVSASDASTDQGTMLAEARAALRAMAVKMRGVTSHL